MPEGDTLFRIARTLRKVLAGRMSEIRGHHTKFGKDRVVDVVARGKNLLIQFEKRTLRTHLGMSGAWHVYREGERWQRPAHLARVALHTDDGWVAVCFAAPRVEWLQPGALDELGPDATSDPFEPATAIRRLRSRPEETPVAEALLDQTAMAGVGNIVKCEALFSCRQDPFAPMRAVDDARLARLVDECREQLLQRRESRNGPNRVYGRAGKPCPRCGETIVVRRGRRLTWLCPRCQR